MSLINIEKTITLDVYDHDTTPSVIKTIQLDTGTRTVFAMIQNSRQDYDIGQNATVSLTVLRPDKTKVQITGQPYISHTGTDGTMYGAKAELSDVALAVKGNLKAQFKITSGEQELRSEIFTINNGEALDAGAGDWAGDLDGHNLDEMAQDIEDTKAAVSEMETDVSELKSGLSELKIEVNLDLVADEYVTRDGNIASYSGWSRTDYIDVSTASIIYINNKFRATDYCHFYDAEKNPTGNYFNVSIGDNIIPTNGAKYVILSNQTGSINNGKMKIWLPLSDASLEAKGKPADAYETGKNIKQSIIGALNETIYNWSFYGSESYPYGWRTGRYDAATGNGDTSGYYMRTLATSRIIPSVDGAKYFKISVPTGYAVQVSEFDINNDTFIKTYGNSDVRSETATAELLMKVEHGKNYKFSVGRFANNDSGNYINDATLINNFKLSIYWTDDYADIPEYYFPYIDEKVNRINLVSKTIDPKSMSFIFITDYHSLRNAKQSKKLINYIVKNTGINTVVFGGDAFQNWKALDESMSEISKVYDTLRKAGESRFLCVYGNHEWNDTTGQLNTLAGVTQITTKGVHNVPVMDRYGNYYIDDAISETRTFFLTCSVSGSIPWESILWLGNQLLTMPNNWNALVICHAGLLSENGTVIQKNTYANVSKLLGAFGDHVSTTLYDSDNVERGTFDYTNATGTTVAFICGHVHEDLEILKANSDHNMLTFSTTGDLYANASGTHYTFKDENGTTITRNVGTIYEQAFDVVHIDTYNKHIYCTRIGAGVDREFTF